MAFREKSAWIMFMALLLAGAFYFYTVAGAWVQSGELAGPQVPLIASYTIFLVVLSVVGHIVISAFAPKDASAGADERDRNILNRAGCSSSIVLATGIVLFLGLYLVTQDGNLLFYAIFASLMVGHVADYALQILFYRTAL